MDENEHRQPAGRQTPNPTTPDFAHASVAAAKDLIAMGELRRARLMLEGLVKDSPEPESFLLLAQLELDNPKRQPDALEHLRRAVAMEPQYTQAWLTLANYWSLRGQPDKQRRCLEKVLAYEPRNADARDAIELLITKK